jgi:hypothetical protein
MVEGLLAEPAWSVWLTSSQVIMIGQDFDLYNVPFCLDQPHLPPVTKGVKLCLN